MKQYPLEMRSMADFLTPAFKKKMPREKEKRPLTPFQIKNIKGILQLVNGSRGNSDIEEWIVMMEEAIEGRSDGLYSGCNRVLKYFSPVITPDGTIRLIGHGNPTKEEIPWMNLVYDIQMTQPFNRVLKYFRKCGICKNLFFHEGKPGTGKTKYCSPECRKKSLWGRYKKDPKTYNQRSKIYQCWKRAVKKGEMTKEEIKEKLIKKYGKELVALYYHPKEWLKKKKGEKHGKSR